MTVRLARGLLTRAARGQGMLSLVLIAPPEMALSWLTQADQALQRTPLTARGLPDEPETPGMVHVLPQPDGALLLADLGDLGRAARRRAVEVVVTALEKSGADGNLETASTMTGPGPVLSPACGAYLILSADADPASIVRRLLPYALPDGHGTGRFISTEVPVDREAVAQIVRALRLPGGAVTAYDTDGTSTWSSIATGWTFARHARMSLHLGLGGPAARLDSGWERLRDAMISVAGDLSYGCVYSAPSTEWLAGPPGFALPQFVDDDFDMDLFHQEPDLRVPGAFWAQVLGPKQLPAISGQRLDAGRRLIQLGHPSEWRTGHAASLGRAQLGLE